MKKVIERIVESPGAPSENDLWLNGKTLKKFQNGEWVAISGGGSGSASSLSDMTDVDISSPSDGDTLVYNATTHKWESGTGGDGCSCLAPMIVAGTISEEGLFTPGSGAPTFTEAQTHMFSGGLLYLLLTNDGEPFLATAATLVSGDTISSFVGNDSVRWEKYTSYFVNGTFAEELHAFIPDENEMSWSEAKDLFDQENSVYLNGPGLTLMVSSYDPVNIALVAYNDALDETYYWRNPNLT